MAVAFPWASRALPVRSRVTATAYLPDSLYLGRIIVTFANAVGSVTDCSGLGWSPRSVPAFQRSTVTRTAATLGTGRGGIAPWRATKINTTTITQQQAAAAVRFIRS